MELDLLSGIWTYRSWYNDPNLAASTDSLVFGNGYIRIDPSPFDQFRGLIYGPHNGKDPNPYDAPFGWQLPLKGATNLGNPTSIRFQGKGVIAGNEWIYNYIGYLIQPWQNGNDEKSAIVGSIVRVVPHPSGEVDNNGQPVIHPAGVVASWYAVKIAADND